MTIYLQAAGTLAVLGTVLAAVLTVANRLFANYGPCAVTINDRDPFTIDGGGKLLDALYGQRIFIPSACGGQGTCGFCKVKVLEGGGPLLPTETPYLTDDEIDGNVRLACQVKVKQDMTVEIRADYLDVQEFKARVKSARMMTRDTREVTLTLLEPDTIDFRPGQYVQVLVPGKGDPQFRAYSISTPPSRTGEIELLIRLIPGGLGSTYLHNVQEGDAVTLTGPYGEYEMAPQKDTAIVCVGGGCGMAPMRSILRHIAETEPDRACWLFFGARTGADTMYMDDFRALAAGMPNFHVHYALSEPADDEQWDGETGFIHESVARHLGSDGRRQAFLCGPPMMIEATMKVLREKGIDDQDIFYDEF